MGVLYLLALLVLYCSMVFTDNIKQLVHLVCCIEFFHLEINNNNKTQTASWYTLGKRVWNGGCSSHADE